MSTFHAGLGFERQYSDEPHKCSSCCDEIPEEHVPLMLFSQGTPCRLWIYCEACEDGMYERLLVRSLIKGEAA